MGNEYTLVSYQLFGKVFYAKRRSITKQFWSKVDFDITNELPISELFISDFPLILKGKYELYQDSRPYWEYFATEIVAYAIIEAFLIGMIGIETFRDNTSVAFNLYDENFVGLVLVPGKRKTNDKFWIHSEIYRLCFHSTINGNSGSYIEEQLSILTDSFIENSEYPFREFSQALVLRMNGNSELYKVVSFVSNNYLFGKYNARVEISDRDWKSMKKKLTQRKALINSVIIKDRFLLRLFDTVKNYIFEDLRKKTIGVNIDTD